MDIIQDKEKLRRVCVKVNFEEGLEIANQLLEVLDNFENGVGLAAPQIGIYKRVAVVRLYAPIILINPYITFGKLPEKVTEGCLSFPGIEVFTHRFLEISYFTANSMSIQHSCGYEAVAVQHEIDHLFGILMFNRSF